MATVTFLYPAGPDFDLDYFTETHLPLVVTTWAMVGFKSYEVIQYTAKGSQYQIEAVLRWDSVKSWDKAPKNDIYADIPRFTKAKPVILAGNSQSTFAI